MPNVGVYGSYPFYMDAREGARHASGQLMPAGIRSNHCIKELPHSVLCLEASRVYLIPLPVMCCAEHVSCTHFGSVWRLPDMETASLQMVKRMACFS